MSGCTVSPARGSGDPAIDPFTDERIATIRIFMKAKDWDFTLQHAFDEQYVPADFWFDDELVPNVGLRPKGNSSLGQAVGWGNPRLPLAVDFNIFNRARSFHGLKKVFLNNGWSDPTLIREALAYPIFASLGIPTPRASLVDVWVNDTHLGVYTMAEVPDKAFLQRHFADASGNLYKPEVMAARLDWTEKDATKKFNLAGITVPQKDPVLGVNIGGAPFIEILKALGEEESVAGYKPEPEAEGNMFRGLPPTVMADNYVDAVGLKTNEDNPDYTALFRFLEVLNKEPDATFPQEIEKVLDVDETLRFLAASAVVVHLDNYIGIGHNNYLYEAGGKFYFIPWDMNMAFGTFNMGIRKNGIINYYVDEPTGAQTYRYPVVKRLLSYQPYLDRYHTYIQQLLDGPFSPDVILPRIDRLAEMVRPYAKADDRMFYTYEDWERCLTEDLRPPDLFEGWMAGGASPNLPFYLSAQETAGLRQEFGASSLYEIVGRDFQPGEVEKLKDILTPTNYSLFLQNIYGPLQSPQPPRQPGFGPNSLGLKTFIAARYESVRKQLSGELPAGTGVGMGNGGSLWMVDWMNMAR
jgi:spore coat protein CotH